MSKIKYLILDVDGSITDGKIYMGSDGEAMKAFSIKDGYAVKYLLYPAGIDPIVITGRTSQIVINRCREIGIKRIYQGKTEKYTALLEAVGEEALGACAYFGDDILDLACMRPIKQRGGLVGCPADAVAGVKEIADYITAAKAGEGAFREFCEWLIRDEESMAKTADRVQQTLELIQTVGIQSFLEGDRFVNAFTHYTVQTYQTKPLEACKLESHRKYVDIQWIVSGEEEMQVSDIAGLCPEKEYDEESDLLLWKPVSHMARVKLTPGSYIVLYPRDAHMGCIAAPVPAAVKKIVFKVAVDGGESV